MQYCLPDLRKNYPKGTDLPEEVNSLARAALSRIGDDDGLRALAEFEKNRWHGTIYSRDSAGALVAYFEMQGGVARQWKLVKMVGACEMHVNIRNKNIYTKLNS